MFNIPKPKQKKEKMRIISGIPGKVAKFDQKKFDKYDVEGRIMIKNILKDNIKDNENIYGEDMIFTIEDFPYKFLEIQVMSYWDNDIFPYKYPFVYARKMRFSEETLFVTFNKHLSQIILFDRKSISEHPSRLKKYDREFVNYVHWRKTMRITTDKLTPKLIKMYSGEYIDSSDELC